MKTNKDVEELKAETTTDLNNELVIEAQTSELQLLDMSNLELEQLNSTELRSKESESLDIIHEGLEQSHLEQERVNVVIDENQHLRNIDLTLEEELKDLAMHSEEEVLNLDYAGHEIINLDLSLVENFVDLSVSPLEKLEVDLPTKDFGWGCSKVTELKDYIKQKEIKEYEEEYEDLEGYNIS